MPEIFIRPTERTSLKEARLPAQVKALTGGLTHSKEGEEYAKKHFSDSLDKADSHTSFTHARSELLFRIEGYESRGASLSPREKKQFESMKRAESRLQKTQESLEKSKPDTWYGKLGKSLMTTLRGMYDSFRNVWERHLQSPALEALEKAGLQKPSGYQA